LRPIEHRAEVALLDLSRLSYYGADEICLRLVVCLSIMVETIGEHPLDLIILLCGLHMGSQVVAEGEGAEVCLPSVLYDVDVMGVGAPFAEGVSVCVAQNRKERVAQASKPFDVGINWA